MTTKNKLKNPSSLSFEFQTDIYFQLSRMEEAGLSTQKAVSLLNINSKINKQQMQRYLTSGYSITDSGLRAGFFNSQDKDLLNAGEIAGNMGVIYRQLADYYDQKSKRTKKIKSQLYLPSTIFILALFIQPFPALILNEITGLQYLTASFGQIFKTVFFFYAVFKIPLWLTDGPLGFLGMGQLVYQLQLKLPYLSTWLISRQINEFFRSLALMLKAGIPILEALPKAINTIKNPLLRKQFLPAIVLVSKGQSLTESLTGIREIDRKAIQLLLVGEKSGKLAKTLLRFTKAESEKHGLQEQLLAEWVPRLFYFLVTAWLAHSLITANLFGKAVL